VKLRIKLEGVVYDVEVEQLPDPEAAPAAAEELIPDDVAFPPPPTDIMPGDRICRSPINGAVVAVLVKPGDKVHKDDPVAVIEAMKMQISIGAPLDGTVVSVSITAGQAVAPGQTICKLA
jgi:glutaconyl-CoA/methylmalonyl-CoA decarboxylase subunit gamma